jgi:hypothetical protein
LEHLVEVKSVGQLIVTNQRSNVFPVKLATKGVDMKNRIFIVLMDILALLSADSILGVVLACCGPGEGPMPP